MHRIILCELLIAGCGLLPPDEKPAPKADGTVDLDIAQLAHPWKIASHILAPKASLSEREASDMHGRSVSVGPADYKTPWHGTCEVASREKRRRAIGDIVREVGLPDGGANHMASFGLGDPLLEFRLLCTDHQTRTPALTIYVSKGHAMTCFAGACYLLKP